MKTMAYTMLSLAFGRAVLRLPDGGPKAAPEAPAPTGLVHDVDEPADDDEGHEEVAVQSEQQEQNVNDAGAGYLVGGDEGYQWDQRMSQPWNPVVFSYQDPLPPQSIADEE
jgi:hypothetical protein